MCQVLAAVRSLAIDAGIICVLQKWMKFVKAAVLKFEEKMIQRYF